MKNYGIHWFRRDLRVAGNEALKWNWQQNEGRVLGLFCFDKKFLARSDFSVNRFQFFLNTLKELEVELKNLGSDLLILDIGPMHAFPELFDKIVSNHKSLPSLVTWNRDYEPFARARDSSMEDFLRSKSISFKHFRDHLIIEPDQLSKTDGTAYQVYTPFSQKWLEIFKTPTVQKVIQQQNTGLQYFNKSIKNENSKIFKMKWSQVLQNISEYSENLTKYTNENLKKVTV
ncbi:MAG: deoxyribodipyrimidine photo-lyase, partial [Bdellovibrionales bacterium]|nr:deoxyribodipyrimidine photo-lyase [Bdellovibrionales bacterium]